MSTPYLGSSNQAVHRFAADKDDTDEIPPRKRPKSGETVEPDRANAQPKVVETEIKRDVLLNTSVPSGFSTRRSQENNSFDRKRQHTDQTALIARHYNELEDKGLFYRNQSRIVYMRNFNNWMKSMIINQFTDKLKQDKGLDGAVLRVLDICCGKGGDLLKWKKANISHLICCDIADVSMDQCQRRYNEMINRDRKSETAFTAQFITADCTKVRLKEKFTDPSVQLDCVSCQFAFHYSFESLQQAECMLRNASENLRPGGYFIGTIPDAYDLVARWQKCDGNQFGNDIYNVEFLCDKRRPPLFGAKYNFHLEGVVDCPEFLVHVPTFRKLAQKFGLELVLFERFEDYYKQMMDKGKWLLSVIQAFETYPPCHGGSLLGKDPEDYRHAERYIHNLPSHGKIGTLSRTEWEATSLYAVFAFQKRKCEDHGKTSIK